MVIAVPNPVARVLYNTAKRVRDEVGKGQETLRTAGTSIVTSGAATYRKVVMIPDVDIIVVGVRFVAGGGADAGDTADVIVPAQGEALDVAAGGTNQLVTQITAPNDAEDTVLDAVLPGTATGMVAPNRVSAGQPIVSLFTEADGTVVIWHVQVSYILADEERTY